MEYTVEASVDSSVLSLFFEASFVVQAVMLLLLLMSVFSWTIIFNKTVSLKDASRRLNRFIEQLTDSRANLLKLLENSQTSNDVASRLFVKAVEEVNEAKLDKRVKDTDFRQHLESVLFARTNNELMNIEKHLGFLATVGSSAVFIGLFGTVWGIMDSFQSIGLSKNTSLAVVAPGIAEALLATAMGLIAAIPAKIFYNKFMSDVNRMAMNSDILIPCISKKLLSEARK